MESLPEKNKWFHEKRTIIRYIAVILLQIVMVSPGIHLVKNHESQCRTIESQFKNHLVPGSSCNQTVNLKTDSKTLYYSILKLKYSPSILKHNKG